jgi:hypothetical protein
MAVNLGLIASQISGHLIPSIGFVSIATQTVGSGGASSVSFSNIPQSFKHLQLRTFAQDNRNTNADSVRFAINSDMTDNNYRTHRLIGYSGGALSQDFGNTNGTGVIGGGNYSSTFGASIFDIFDYQNTNKYKAIRVLGGVDTGLGGEVGGYSTLWMNTATVSSITLSPSNGSSFSQYSHFALYGIQGA